MDVLLVLAGAGLVSLTMFDFLKTVIGMAGTGPLAARTTRLLWRLAHRTVPRLRAATGRSFEDAVGPGILVGIAIVWIVLSWAGYTLMFAASGALVGAETGRPVGGIEIIAFTGASISTLGASLAEPGNGWWDALSTLAAINGMIVVTLSVSFIMNVWQTTADARSLAWRTAALDDLAHRMTDEELASALASLGPELARLLVAVRGLPVVGFFASEDSRMSFPLAVLTLCGMARRIGDVPPRQGLSELRLSLAALGELESGRHRADPDFAAACRWAQARRLVS